MDTKIELLIKIIYSKIENNEFKRSILLETGRRQRGRGNGKRRKSCSVFPYLEEEKFRRPLP